MAQRKPTTLLFNPFVYIAGAQALGLGLAAIILAALIGWIAHTHFDGVLDTHSGWAAPLWVFLAEGLIDWLSPTLVLWAAGKIISTTDFRLIDLLGTQALARWPTILISVITLTPGFQRFNHFLVTHLTSTAGGIDFNTPDALVFLATVIVMIPLLCWTVFLMYQSYSVSCNMRGGKAIGTFIGGLIVAEILSKIAVYQLLHLS